MRLMRSSAPNAAPRGPLPITSSRLTRPTSASSTERLLGGADLVAQARGVLVPLVLLRLVELAAQPAQRVLGDGVAVRGLGHASDVLQRAAVDLLEERLELLREHV